MTLMNGLDACTLRSTAEISGQSIGMLGCQHSVVNQLRTILQGPDLRLLTLRRPTLRLPNHSDGNVEDLTPAHGRYSSPFFRCKGKQSQRGETSWPRDFLHLTAAEVVS